MIESSVGDSSRYLSIASETTDSYLELSQDTILYNPSVSNKINTSVSAAILGPRKKVLVSRQSTGPYLLRNSRYSSKTFADT